MRLFIRPSPHDSATTKPYEAPLEEEPTANTGNVKWLGKEDNGYVSQPGRPGEHGTGKRGGSYLGRRHHPP